MGSRRWRVVNDLIGQSVIDVHSGLRAAWKAICKLPPDQRSALIEQISRPLVTEAEAMEMAGFWKKDKVRARRIANEWMQKAEQRYRRIQEQAKDSL
jgi:hypothetical protein